MLNRWAHISRCPVVCQVQCLRLLRSWALLPISRVRHLQTASDLNVERQLDRVAWGPSHNKGIKRPPNTIKQDGEGTGLVAQRTELVDPLSLVDVHRWGTEFPSQAGSTAEEPPDDDRTERSSIVVKKGGGDDLDNAGKKNRPPLSDLTRRKITKSLKDTKSPAVQIGCNGDLENALASVGKDGDNAVGKANVHMVNGLMGHASLNGDQQQARSSSSYSNKSEIAAPPRLQVDRCSAALAKKPQPSNHGVPSDLKQRGIIRRCTNRLLLDYRRSRTRKYREGDLHLTTLNTHQKHTMRVHKPAILRHRRKRLSLRPNASVASRTQQYASRLRSFEQRRLRPKYVSLVSAQRSRNEGTDPVTYLDAFSSTWQRDFSQVIAKFDCVQSLAQDRMHDHTQDRELRERLFHQNVRRWYSRLGSSRTDETSIAQSWYRYRPEQIGTIWSRVMLWTLQDDPRMALRVLKATIGHSLFAPPKHMVEDSLDFISCALLRDVQIPNNKDVQNINILACHFLRTYGAHGTNVSITQRTIFLLAKFCDANEGASLYETLKNYSVELHSNTMLQLITRFCARGQLELAIDALQRTIECATRLSTGIDLKPALIQSVCVRLLRTSFEVENIYNLRCNILSTLLKTGIRPNLQLFNVILLNSMEAGDCQTGWRMYEIANENGLLPNEYTYAILLKSVKYGGDSKTVEFVYRSAMQDGMLSKSPRLATELLHALYIAAKSEPAKPEEAAVFEALLPTYLQFFDSQPLLDLGLLDTIPRSVLDRTTNLTEPHPAALGIMILAYLEQYHTKGDALEIYNRYIHYVEEGHSIIAPLSETTHTANAFLKALSRQYSSLHHCTTVIQHMLTLSASRANEKYVQDDISVSSQGPKPGNRLCCVAGPDVQSWSILALGFIRHGQTAAAEKVVSIMRGRGMWPNQVTWNTLVAGYSLLQDYEGAIGAVSRLEKEGFEADDYTRKALGRVVDRKKLMDAFDAATKPLAYEASD